VLVNFKASYPVGEDDQTRLRLCVRARPCLPLLAWAALALAGCSNEPLPPQGALWTGSSSARTAAATSGPAGGTAVRPSYRAASGGGWGPYSGRRGQIEPPQSVDYAFKGDPNASPTFAGSPGQM
jgi:hypothetical protein